MLFLFVYVYVRHTLEISKYEIHLLKNFKIVFEGLLWHYIVNRHASNYSKNFTKKVLEVSYLYGLQ